MKIERKIIIELLKYENNNKVLELMKYNPNWIEILGFLTYHRLAGLTYEKIKNLNVRNFDYPVYLNTYMINQSQKIRTYEQNKWINIISNELNKKNIRYVFLKGAILNNTLFNYGSRVSNDIDILIEKKSIPIVTDILNKLGFVQGKYNYKTKTICKFTEKEIEESIRTRGETAPFVKKTNIPEIETIDIDINFSIDWKPTDDEIVNDFLNNRILIVKNDNVSIFSLNHYHNFIELCIHLYKDCSLIDIVKKRKVLDLYKFVDIYYYLKKYETEIHMNTLYEIIKKYKLAKYIYFALKYITEIFPDIKRVELENLLKKIEKDNTLNTIYDQNNPSIKMKTNAKILDRIFSYNVIDKYKQEESV